MRLWWGPIGKPYSQLHETSPVKEPRHSGSESSSTHNSIHRPVPFWSVPIRTSRATWHVINSGVSKMIHNLAKFRPHITQPSTGPPSSLPRSGFSGISQSVIPVHMQFIHTGCPKSASQSSSLAQCNTFVFLVCTFLTTYVGTPSAMQVCAVCRSLPHWFFSFCCWPQKASSFTSTRSPDRDSMAPTLWSYRRFCCRASFRAVLCDLHRLPETLVQCLNILINGTYQVVFPMSWEQQVNRELGSLAKH